MNYRVRRQGEELGTFSMEELRERRAAGALTGNEYLQGEGRSDWQPLDLVLQHGLSAMTPPMPAPPARRGPNLRMIWGIVVLSGLLVLGGVGIGIYKVVKVMTALRSARGGTQQPAGNPDAIKAAKKPVSWTTNTLTQTEVNQRAKEFRVRQWLDGYRDRGRHEQPCDAEAKQLIKSWIAENYGEAEAVDLPSAQALSEKLGKAPGCDDPLVLTVAAVSSVEVFEKIRLLERAVKGFEQSKHRAYPKFYALVLLGGETKSRSQRADLDKEALAQLKLAFADGSFTTKDQAEIAELFVNNWAYKFFQRNSTAVYQMAQGGGKDFAWLALVLEGEHHVMEAWKARGGGYSDKVTQQGWEGFSTHLASARSNFSDAWQLRPELPLAASRMIYVCLGESDITEMRLWFDRAVGAQIDYEKAWSDLRWGLRPRWYGDADSMLALGVTAVNTGRFDTDVPRMLYDAITDVESEMELSPGEHIYGREDVWPHLQKMYEGYIASPAQSAATVRGWRSTYAVMAYYAGRYDVARAQFEALNWQPERGNLEDWDTEFSLLPEEVAARTGPVGKTVARAESSRERGEIAASLALYRELDRSTNADTRTREFVRYRLASLEQEQHLQRGEWIDLQPLDEHDPNWVFWLGKTRILPDGALEVESGPEGHLLYSRVRVGPRFEVKGEFEVVRSSTGDFQAGLVMGLPDLKGYRWNSFRMKRNNNEGRVACFGHGWNQPQTINKVEVRDHRNSFSFRFEDFKASASLNGTEVFRDAAQPQSLYMNDDGYLLGLGAFNDVNNTVIRYHNVQVRRLEPAAPAAKRR